MYSLTIRSNIMIAHSLVGAIFGPAQNLHGATFVVEATFRRARLSADGLVVDIGAAANLLKAQLTPLNYRNLDELTEYAGRNTTTEFLAGDIHRRLTACLSEGALGDDGRACVSLCVTLRESPDAWASYDGPLR